MDMEATDPRQLAQELTIKFREYNRSGSSIYVKDGEKERQLDQDCWYMLHSVLAEFFEDRSPFNIHPFDMPGSLKKLLAVIIFDAENAPEKVLRDLYEEVHEATVKDVYETCADCYEWFMWYEQRGWEEWMGEPNLCSSCIRDRKSVCIE